MAQQAVTAVYNCKIVAACLDNNDVFGGVYRPCKGGLKLEFEEYTVLELVIVRHAILWHACGMGVNLNILELNAG